MTLTITDPTPLKEALAVAEKKNLLPVGPEVGSAELSKLDQELTQKAVFSARMDRAGVLQTLLDNFKIAAGGGEDEAGRLRSIPEAKAQLKAAMYKAGVPLASTDTSPMQDFFSDTRRALMVETNVLDTMNAGRFIATQNPEALDVNPGYELVRFVVPKGGVAAERDWVERWHDAMDEIGSDAEDGCTDPDDAGGRMVALKNHPIWQALGDGAGGYTDTLGNKWAPFAFNSGMNLIDVPRADCVALGIIDEDQQIEPDESIDINSSLEANVEKFDAALQQALVGGGLKIIKGILRIANRDVSDEPRDRRGRWAEAFGRLLPVKKIPTIEPGTGVFAPRTGQLDQADIARVKWNANSLLAKKMALTRERHLQLKAADEQAQRELAQAKFLGERAKAQAEAEEEAPKSIDAIQKGATLSGQRRFVFVHPESGKVATIDYATKKYGLAASVRESGDHEIHPALQDGVHSLLAKGYRLQRSTLRKALARRGVIINRLRGLLSIANAGTSEGAYKGWDTRREGEKQKGIRAIKTALQTNHDAVSAMFHPAVGAIDFPLDRRGGKGLLKIVADHGKEAALNAPHVIAYGNVEPRQGERQVISKDGFRVVLTRSGDKDRRHWMLTAYDSPKKKPLVNSRKDLIPSSLRSPGLQSPRPGEGAVADSKHLTARGRLQALVDYLELAAS